MKINEDWTSSRGGATMQTSPCRVFRIPIPYYLIWRSPDRVHGGWIHLVKKANNVYRQKIIVPSDFVRCSWCCSLSPGWCLKKGKGDQWKWTVSRGGATMQTSPCRVFKIPILYFLKCDIPNRVHGGCSHDVNTSNIVCTQSITASSDKRGNIWCGSLLSGQWLKKGREINSSYDKTSIWNENNRFILNTGWIAHPLQHLTPITGHM